MRKFRFTDRTFGPSYDEDLDGKRIKTQMEVIRDYMLNAFPVWKTLSEIETILHYPQASISAQLRHLRKQRFGSYVIEKQRRSVGTWEYRIRKPIIKKNGLFD